MSNKLCGAISRDDGLRENAVCVRPTGHASYHATTTEDVVESATGYFWHDLPFEPNSAHPVTADRFSR